MAYPIYPANLPTPEAPFGGELLLPLSSSNAEEIGAYLSRRDRTRANIRGSVTIKLDVAQASIFLTWQRVTLNKGLIPFTAQWITDLGYIGYVARFPSFSMGLLGMAPNPQLDVELIPDVRYSFADATIPSPFPPKDYG